MADPSVTPPAPPATASADSQADDFDIREEYGTARKNLPPVWIVAICVLVVAGIALIYAFTHKPQAHSTGNIEDVTTVTVPGQDMTLVAINVSIQNQENKPEWVKSIEVAADVNGNKVSDEAVPAVDAQRYFQSFPDLKQHARDLITLETRFNPGARSEGTVVAALPVKTDAFATRKSLTVTITPYDEMPIVISK